MFNRSISSHSPNAYTIIHRSNIQLLITFVGESGGKWERKGIRKYGKQYGKRGAVPSHIPFFRLSRNSLVFPSKTPQKTRRLNSRVSRVVYPNRVSVRKKRVAFLPPFLMVRATCYASSAVYMLLPYHCLLT